VTTPFGLEGKALVAALQGLPTDDERAAWERCSVSRHSPGPVQDDEMVVRVLDQPLHVGSDDMLKPSAFTDLESLGMSVQRLAHCMLSEVLEHSRARTMAHRERRASEGLADDCRQPMALLRLKVRDLRELHTLHDKLPRRAVGVYDSAREGHAVEAAHADAAAFGKGAAARRARAWLHEYAKTALEKIGPA
jgi:hypothetical protein